jgi:hypothetical protein
MKWLLVWGFGLVFAAGVGHLLVEGFLKWLRGALGLETPQDQRVQPWVTGVLERVFFTIAVGAGVSSDVLTPMFAWLALKLGANWKWAPDGETPKARRKTVNYMFSALLGGLVSLLIAVLAGLFIRRFAPHGP